MCVKLPLRPLLDSDQLFDALGVLRDGVGAGEKLGDKGGKATGSRHFAGEYFFFVYLLEKAALKLDLQMVPVLLKASNGDSNRAAPQGQNQKRARACRRSHSRFGSATCGDH